MDAEGCREQLQTADDNFAVGRASGGADFEPNAVGFDAQARAGEHRRHAAGKTVSQQDRQAENLRAKR